MNSEQVYFINDEFVAFAPGKPIRLFPFGKLVKGGKVREFTRELAEKFRLPHFKPPIKLGSHKDETPAGGRIISLEVGEDGLYAHVELNEEGRKALENGAYGYHSPEVIWEEGEMETNTGAIIPGPIILGDALLHTPHLGEAAALYSIEKKLSDSEEQPMETVQVPQSLWQKVEGIFEGLANRPDPEPEPEPTGVEPEKYEALQKEHDDMAAEIEAMKADKAEAEKLTAIRASLETDEFGAAFKGLAEEEGAVDMLATFNEEQRAWVETHFKALSAQIDESALTGEHGSDEEPPENLNAAIEKYAAENKIPYHEAQQKLAKEKPELFEQEEEV